MINKKVILVTIPVAILTAGVILFLIYIQRPERLYISFNNIDNTTSTLITDYLQIKYPDIKIVTTSDNYDLLITTNRTEVDNLAPFNGNIDVMPSAMRALSIANSHNILVPLQLDYIELLISNIHYSNLVNGDDQPTLKEYIDFITPLKEPGYYPLIIAGKDNTSLMDFISILVVSHSSTIKFNELVEMIYNGDDFKTISEIRLTTDMTFQDLLDILIEWKRNSILHTEWLNFDHNDVKQFVEEEVTASAIIRLSEHRTYNKKRIKKYSAIPFPTDRDEIYTKDIVTIPLYAGMYSDSKNNFFLQSLISDLLKEEFQKKLTYTTGLAPVNSTVQTMDKQATDLRYWAASADRIATTPYIVEKEDNNLEIFLTSVRNYLISNR